MKEKAKSLLKELKTLNIYRSILEDEIIKDLIGFLEIFGSGKESLNTEKLAYDFFYKLLEEGEKNSLKGDIFKAYMKRLLIESENIFTIKSEKIAIKGTDSLGKLVKNDFMKIKNFLKNINQYLKSINRDFIEIIEILENYSKQEDYEIFDREIDEIYDYFTEIYFKDGCGVLSRSQAFRWDGNLVPIIDYDKVDFKNIIGYERQKNSIIENTKSFIDGKPANNILLAGARGTGKSSSVKALLNEFEDESLKILELSKEQLFELNIILEILKKRGKKFIIFMDDLSFEDFETDYKHMKSILEGGVEKKPENVIMYVTSNRRHLIKETWNERGSEDIHESDAINEKLSLSDRFGITLYFSSPNQKEYLEIVESLLMKNGFNFDEDIKKEALRWEMSQNGRSGRTAVQFINYILGGKKEK